MIVGSVDGGGRALIAIQVKAEMNATAQTFDAWLDTGFTGELLLPQSAIEGLRLPQSAALTAELGDGSTVLMKTHTGPIDWFGSQRLIEVVASSGGRPLLGIGILLRHKVTIDYVDKTLTIE